MSTAIALILSFIISLNNSWCLAHTNESTSQTRAQVYNLDAETINTNSLSSSHADLGHITAEHAIIENLQVANIDTLYKKSITFHVKDFFRLGTKSLNGIRTISNTVSYPMVLPAEINGWTMKAPQNTDDDNHSLYISTHLPDALSNDENNVMIEAFFIMPLSDAPQEGLEKFVKIGYWLHNIPNELSLDENKPLCFASNNVMIPTKNLFSNSNIMSFSVKASIPSSMISDGLFHLLFRRINVSKGKTEFEHNQGITFIALTIYYPSAG